MTLYTQHYLRGQQFQDPLLQATFNAEIDFLLKKFLECNAQSALEVGCGNGRTLRRLAPRIHSTKGEYTLSAHLWGVDIDPELIRLADIVTDMFNWPGAVEMYSAQDARKTNFVDGQFDLSFSTHNTLGELDRLDDRYKIIGEMARVTRPGGLVTNITWKRDDTTTEFLREYYPAIGFEIVDLTSGRTVVKSKETGEQYEFVRIHPGGLEFTYSRYNLTDFSTEEVGPLMVAVTAKKK